MRWRWPPENSCGYFLASAGFEPHLGQRPADPRVPVPGVARQLEGVDRLGDDVADPPARVEAGEGVLEDHLQPATERVVPGVGDVLAVEPDRAAIRLVESDHQTRHGRLATAALADQRHGLALGDGEADPVHRVQPALRLARHEAVDQRLGEVERLGEIVDGEKRLLSHRLLPPPLPRAPCVAPVGHRASRRRASCRRSPGGRAAPGGSDRTPRGSAD